MKKTKLIILMVFWALSITACSGKNESGKLFTTEYDVEDYCENMIIVSKSEGMVSGILDSKGKEILPLEYDEIEFFNKDSFVQGKDDALYLKIKYEGAVSIIDTNKKAIIKTTGYISHVKTVLRDEKNNKSPFFCETVNDKNNVYNENGVKIGEIAKPKGDEEIIWINNKYYCIKNKLGNGIAIYDYSGNKISQFDEFMSKYYIIDNSIKGIVITKKIYGYTYNPFNDENADIKLISISSDGKIGVEKNINTVEDLTLEEEKLENMSEKDLRTYNLYNSNGTWKLEDINGRTLYENRYFERLTPNGMNDCVALTNEDNSVCIIGRQGTRYVDFGILRYAPDSKEILMKSGKEKEVKINNVFEGKDSIIIPVSGENGNDIYLFSGK